ncbi:MAG: hypothetical protein JNK82_14445 [Myxococcaceae bacterium]|nr:hypothetical protein [Myxococcaceae bacterium]
MDSRQLEELMVQTLEHEVCGVKVYEAALTSVVNHGLREEWSEHLEATRQQVELLKRVCWALRIDATNDTPSRLIIRENGNALISTIQAAKRDADAPAAQLLACETVVIAETMIQTAWQVLTRCAPLVKGDGAQLLEEACAVRAALDGERLRHAKGWCRELWLESLGVKANLPPPEVRRRTTRSKRRAVRSASSRR